MSSEQQILRLTPKWVEQSTSLRYLWLCYWATTAGWWDHRHQSNIDCLMACTTCLVCFISTVNGRNKKKKKPSLGRAALVGGT